MSRFLSSSPLSLNAGLTLIRIILGAFLVYHGWEIFSPAKMQEYQTWDMFKGTSLANYSPYIGKGAELTAGILFWLGLWTRIAALLTAGTMAYIAFIVGHGKIWYEDQYPFLFVLLAMLFFFTGPGSMSLDRLLYKK